MSTDSTLLLEVSTAARRYLVPRAHLDHLAQVAPGAQPGPHDATRPQIARELGPLLDRIDVGAPGRRHALIVRLRRRSVALLVERAEALGAPGFVQPLDPLLARRLARPWVLGAIVLDQAPVLVLDLRRIAADLALGVVG